MTITLSENDNDILRKTFEALSEIYIFDVKYVIKQRIMTTCEYIYILEEVLNDVDFTHSSVTIFRSSFVSNYTYAYSHC